MDEIYIYIYIYTHIVWASYVSIYLSFALLWFSKKKKKFCFNLLGRWERKSFDDLVIFRGAINAPIRANELIQAEETEKEKKR